ncbi:hydroxymethylbilane synthase [Brachyspira pilosicoli]|uniref:hydroxymethylbilane synthase n=1 Tax=Brachyspira pilosicoli TaxID=52584 RepID=UPI00258D9969|nr:hydroxymethylbilane synthase [uncultured Brachyspira sp.]
MSKKFIVGSRASKLALVQTNIVIDKLKKIDKLNDIEIEIKEITTSGDRHLIENPNSKEKSLKGAFTKEIEEALLDKRIDFAVHSMKDMPTISTKGLVYASVPQRDDARDVLISKNNIKFNDLKKGSIIGTTSLRRSSSVMMLRDDLIVKPIRGNIHTRLKKLETEDYNALILASAAMKRLNLENMITEYFSIDNILPAPGQGALCVQCREDDNEIIEMLKLIEDAKVRELVDIEREFACLFDSGCNSPVGCYTEVIDDDIIVHGNFFCNDKNYRDTISLNEVKDKNNLAYELYKKIKLRMQLDS